MRIRSVLGAGTMVVVRLPLEARAILPHDAGEGDRPEGGGGGVAWTDYSADKKAVA
jgi:hypothetical protein